MERTRFVKLYHDWPDHAKTVEVSMAARAMYAGGLAISGRTESDGALTKTQVHALCNGDRTADPDALADELVNEGFWSVSADEKGRVIYLIDGFDEHQETSSTIAARKQRNRVNQAASRARKAEKANEHKADVSDDIAMTKRGVSSIDVDRDIDLDVEKKQGRASAAFLADFEAVWAKYPRKKSKKTAFGKYQARRRDGVSGEDLMRAVEIYAIEVAGVPEKMIMHGSRFFGPNEEWLERLQAADQPDDADSPLFVALVRVEGGDPSQVTASQRARVQQAALELTEVGATPVEVERRARVYAAKHPDWELTATSLAARWASVEGRRQQRSQDGEPDYEGAIFQ